MVTCRQSKLKIETISNYKKDIHNRLEYQMIPKLYIQ